ncbi:MAG: tetratricopeptide repeat protein [Bacteroidota bacterium]
MLRNLFLLLFSVLIALQTNSQSSKSASDFYSEGLDLQESKNYKDALAAFKKANAIKANDADFLYEAGWCCNKLHLYTEAVTYLGKAVKLNPENTKMIFELAYSQQNSKMENDAILNYKKVLESSSDPNYEANKNLGDIFYNNKDYKSAIINFKAYLFDDEPINDYYFKAGFSMNQLKNFDEAIEYLEKYEPKRNDEIGKKFAEIGYANYLLEDMDKAIEAYKKSLEALPDNGTTLRALGNIYYDNTNESDKALKYFELAIEKDEKNSKALYKKLATIYLSDERHNDDAIKMLKKAIVYDARDVEIRQSLGYVYYLKNDYSNALIQLNKAIELDPKSYEAYCYKGLIFLEMKNKSEAMNMYNKLKNINAYWAKLLLDKININK